MTTICGTDCCDACPRIGNDCAGCERTSGHPCGGHCVAAEAVEKGGDAALAALRRQVIDEINALGIPGLSVTELHLLSGAYVDLAYPLPNGQTVQLLDPTKVYFGNQIERPGNERCYGVVADEDILLVAEYGAQGADPALLLYKKR